MSLPEDIRFVPLVTAKTQTDALRIRLLLDRTRVHYLVKNEGVQNLIGGGAFATGYNPATGPIEFHVLASQRKQVDEALLDLFEIHHGEIPDTCPACESSNLSFRIECPNCGLFLA